MENIKKEYVEREALRDELYFADAITMNGVKIFNQFPASDVVSASAYEQVLWERDLAIHQLRNDYNTDIGAVKNNDVVTVVRCKNCKWNNGTGAFVNHKCIKTFYAVVVPPNHFCSYGERKNVNA